VRNARLSASVSSTSRKRLLMWQMSVGNTLMRSQNNTCAHD
jgi:hypothetical protein